MNCERRKFLRSAVATAAGLSTIPLVNACSSLDRVDMKPTVSSGNLPADLQEILRLAALAPSSHNTQPWRVRVHNERHLNVTADSSRALPVIDPKHRELFLSLGTFLENLVQAAGAVGLDTELTNVAAAETNPWQTDIAFHSARATQLPVERLKRRRTLRDGYKVREISASLLTLLETESQCKLAYLPRGSREATALGEATLAAFEQQTASNAAQKELSEWIRFSSSDADCHRDGITPSMMGIEGFANWVVRHFYDADDVLKPSFRAKGVENTANQVKQGAGWLLITSRDETDAGLVEAGRSFERLALLVREHGLALHPMFQALEESPWRNELVKTLGLTDPIQFILRCGFVDHYPKPVSIRRPVAWFTIDERRVS